MSILSELKKEKEFLVCADSDGCVMDVMDAAFNINTRENLSI